MPSSEVDSLEGIWFLFAADLPLTICEWRVVIVV